VFLLARTLAIRKLFLFYLNAPYSFPEIMRLTLSPRARTNFFSMSFHYPFFLDESFLFCARYLPFYQPCVNHATKSHTNTYMFVCISHCPFYFSLQSPSKRFPPPPPLLPQSNPVADSTPICEKGSNKNPDAINK